MSDDKRHHFTERQAARRMYPTYMARVLPGESGRINNIEAKQINTDKRLVDFYAREQQRIQGKDGVRYFLSSVTSHSLHRLGTFY